MPKWKKAMKMAKKGMPEGKDPLGPMPKGIKEKMMRKKKSAMKIKKNMGEGFTGAYGGKM